MKTKKLKVRDLMTEEVRSLSTEDSALVAWDLMDEKRIRHVPVVDDAGEVVGLLSERDLLRNALAGATELPVSAQRDYLRGIRIEEIMTSVPYTVEPESDLAEAGRMLLEFKISCLPVVEGDTLVGIVTESDFVRRLVEMSEA
jgi:CBS domain-containing membrane protein